MTKPKGSTGGRLIHLTSSVYRIVVWLLTQKSFDLGFKATNDDLAEANKQKENFVVIGTSDEPWPNGYRLEHQKTGKLYVPDECKEEVLTMFHSIDEPKRRGTHPGVKRTYNLIKQYYPRGRFIVA